VIVVAGGIYGTPQSPGGLVQLYPALKLDLDTHADTHLKACDLVRQPCEICIEIASCALHIKAFHCAHAHWECREHVGVGGGAV